MTTIRLSWVSFLHDLKSTETLKFGFPIIVSRALHPSKQYVVLVAFYPNPAGSVREVIDLQNRKQWSTFVAFCPNPAGSSRDGRLMAS